MSAPVTLRAVLDVAKPDLISFLSTAKDEFMRDFGAWVQSAHRDRLERVFLEAGRAKIAALSAETHEEAKEWDEVYFDLVASLDTIGLDVKIMGEVEARIFLKASLHRAIALIPIVAGIVIKVVLGAFVPVAGGVVGPIVGSGVEYLLAKVFG